MAAVDREAVAAWTIWAIMVLAGLWFVAAYGFTMPYGDEWVWLPVVAGQEPVSVSWLWSMHNEHRMVLPRLIYMGLGMATDFDFRAGCFFNIVALGGLSLAMMLAARTIRACEKMGTGTSPDAISTGFVRVGTEPVPGFSQPQGDSLWRVA